MQNWRVPFGPVLGVVCLEPLCTIGVQIVNLPPELFKLVCILGGNGGSLEVVEPVCLLALSFLAEPVPLQVHAAVEVWNFREDVANGGLKAFVAVTNNAGVVELGLTEVW